MGLKIYREDSRSVFMGEILRGIRPDVDFLGFTNDLAGPDHEAVLILDPGWPDLIGGRKGGKAENLFVMPIPLGNPWSYWEFSRRVHGAFGEVRKLSDEELAAVLGPDEGDGLRWTRHYMRFNAAILQEHQDRIGFVLGNLADEESTRSYMRVLTAEPLALWRHYAANTYNTIQYFDPKLLSFDEGAVVLNGGVHDGFEIPFFCALTGTGGKTFNFDPCGFDFLSDYVRETIGFFGSAIEERRVALWDREGEVSLYMGEEQVVGREAKGEVRGVEARTFPCTSIDGFVAAEGLDRADLIKMDLEGAEVQAVVGMMETVRTLRPQLAISIYHGINDFWDIPMYLMNKCENYAFFIRSYSSQLEETVLYAIPRERLQT